MLIAMIGRVVDAPDSMNVSIAFGFYARVACRNACMFFFTHGNIEQPPQITAGISLELVSQEKLFTKRCLGGASLVVNTHRAYSTYHHNWEE